MMLLEVHPILVLLLHPQIHLARFLEEFCLNILAQSGLWLSITCVKGLHILLLSVMRRTQLSFLGWMEAFIDVNLIK